MRALVSINAHGDHAMLRRYIRHPGGPILCTHEGLYEPEGVTPGNVSYYVARGADQDWRNRNLPAFETRLTA